MAKLFGEIDAKSILTLNKSFARANGQPLDSSEIYYSKAKAEEYAQTDIAYVGQKIVVVENGIVTHYSIEDTAGTLKKLIPPSPEVSLDETSITNTADGKITIKGFNEIPNGVYTNSYIPHAVYDKFTGATKTLAWGQLNLVQDKVDTNKYNLQIMDSEGAGAEADRTTVLGSITLPDIKDTVVQSGELVISNVNDDLFVGAIAGETYLKLIIANDADNPVFIPVGDLINFDIRDIVGGKTETDTTITELFEEDGKLYAKSDVKVGQ